MKIGFVFDDSLDRNDGVQQYIKTLGPWMKLQGHDVVYLCGETKITDWQGCKVYSMTKNVNVKFNANRLSIPRPTSNRYIKSVLNEENFDVLHVQMPHSPLMSQKVIKLADSKTVIFGTFHILPAGKLQHLGSKALSLWYGKSIQIFDKIVAVSPAASDFAATAFKIRASVLPNAVDTKKFSLVKKNKTITDKKTIVFLGRLVKRKGAAELLKAYKIKIPDDNVRDFCVLRSILSRLQIHFFP